MKNRISLFLSLYIFCCLCFADAHIILMGAPGAGKGTLSQELKRNRNYVHISPGNLLRAEIAEGSKIGKEIEEIVLAGEYVSDNTVMSIMKRQMLPGLEQGKFLIIDGYPRSKESLNSLEKFLKEYDIEDKTVVINLNVSESGSINRIAHRFVCPKCSEVYKSKDKYSLCSKCGHKLEVRIGDNEEISKKRYNHYSNTVLPLYKEISVKFPTININTEEKKVTDVYGIVAKFLDETEL